MTPKAIVCDTFAGFDTETSPVELGKIMERTGVVWFPNGNSMYSPDGTYMQKRPGITACTGVPWDLPVYDLIRARLVSTAWAGTDVLLATVPFGVNGTRIYEITPGVLPTVTAAAMSTWERADTARRARLFTAGRQVAILTGVTANSAEGMVVPMVTGNYAVTGYPNPFPPNDDTSRAGYALGEWHKNRVVRAGNVLPLNANRVCFSDFNDPTGTYPPDNKFDVAQEGQFGVIGILSTGDIIYFGKSGSLAYMTGASPDTYRVRTCSLQYGIAGMRGGAIIGPETAVVFLTERKGPLGATEEIPNPRNIGILRNGELKVIGDRVLTLIRVGSDATIDTQVQNWSALQGVLMMPQRTLIAESKRVLMLTPKTRGFWPWTILSSVGPTCLREAGGTMYIGTAAGSGLMYFDDTNPYDVAASNFVTGQLDFPTISTNEDAIIDRVTVICSQGTASAAWSVARMKSDTGSYDTAVDFTPGSVKAAHSVSFTGGNVKASRFHSIRLMSPKSGVASTGCKVFKIIIWLKEGLGK